MPTRGIIYQSGWTRLHGETRLVLSKAKIVGYQFLRGLGAGLISLAVLGCAFSVWPILKEESDYVSSEKEGYFDALTQAENISTVQKQAASLGLDAYFSIYIPKIDAKSKIIPNVDTANETQYRQALLEGIAHAKGTAFPGQGRSIYLFAHSTDTPLNVASYNAIFYLLRKLETGDAITVFFADGKYDYQVQESRITQADDISWLVKDWGEEKLILQTCYPPGTSWKRLMVVANPISK